VQVETAPKAAPLWTDPALLVGTVLVTALHAYVFFQGEHLPYIDWPNHLGLISVLAHGEEMGALDYLRRSFAPNPYALFYFASAALAQVLPTVTAAKVALISVAPALALGAADLFRRQGRDPRLGLLAPLTVFGLPLGWGFASFVFTTPLLLISLARLEALLVALADRGELRAASREITLLALSLTLTYLGHALVLLATGLVGLPRVAVFLLRRGEGRGRWRATLSACALAWVPPVTLGLLRLLTLDLSSAAPTETFAASGDTPWLEFPGLGERWLHLGGHLIDRGSPLHLRSMGAVVGLFFALGGLALFSRPPRPRLRGGLPALAGATLALYAFGPSAIARPVSVWLVHSRFATLAALFVFALPRAKLCGPPGIVLTGGLLAVQAYDAALQAGHVDRVAQLAERYAPVREMVPPRVTVLPLSYGLPPGDLVHHHATLRVLYFYHLVDGAAYIPYLFDNPFLPVRFRSDVKRPPAPFWRTPQRYDPKTHGRAFDYLVLRGTPAALTGQSPFHELVGEANGWRVYRTVRQASRPPP
jgi:hypothetical protein